MPQPGPRARAIRRGDSTYYTGKPCKHGHIAERQTITGACTACKREALEGEKIIFAMARIKRHG